MRQTIINLFSLIIIISFAFGQTLSIQGVIRDDTGASIQGSFNIEFRLYTTLSGGSATWTETQTLTVTNGVYSALLGSVNSLVGLNYDVSYWLGIAIDGADELSPRTKLTMSPYAMMAGMNGITNIFPQDDDVGIGTTSPTSKLHVAGAIKVTGASGTLITNTTETGAGGDAFRIRYDNHLFGSNLDGLIFEKLDANGSYPDGGMMFVNTGESGVAVPALSIKGNGKIGIGINNPTHTLDIRGQIRNDHSSTYDVWLQGGSVTSGEARNLAILGHKAYDKLYLNYGSEYQNGTIIGTNVGIGTASPTSKLHVAGGNIKVQNAESGSGILRVGAAWSHPGIYAEDTNLPLALGSATGKVWFNACKIGIGTNAPLEKLHVVGDAYITNKLFVGENLYQRVDGTSQGWHKLDDESGNDHAYWYEQTYTPSDRRLKTAIETIPSAMKKIVQLRGVYYQWSEEGFGRFTQYIDEDYIAGPEATENENERVKDFYKEKIYQRMGGKQVGVIAQELQEVMPELVQEQEDGYLEVSYGNLVALLIEGMKEQQSQIETLQIRLESLENSQNR